MKKMIVWMLLAMFAMPGVLPQGYAADEEAGIGIVDVGNKICPVMGEPVDGEHFVVYEGKRYGLCCPGCEKAFLADPMSYIAKMDTEERTKVPAAKPGTVVPIDSRSQEMQRDMEQAEL